MAKHLVKCFYCSRQFDANIEDYVMVNSRRYAHKTCAEEAESKKTQKEKDKEQLENYIKQLFGISCISPKIRKQIRMYTEELNYSYSAIYKTLKYWFEVKGNPIEKANGGIGIVPYCIDQARNYWLDIIQTRALNEELNTEQFNIPIREIHIKPLERQPMRKPRELFAFLEGG